MPVAHALVQAREDLRAAASGLTADELWSRPGGAASVGFHLRHIVGSMDRLFTYARGAALDEAQRAALDRERLARDPSVTVEDLLGDVDRAIDAALDRLRGMAGADLLEPRAVGRALLPSTVLGLAFHAAEHTQRHTGQAIATAKIVRARG
jgi:hypothetical protein